MQTKELRVILDRHKGKSWSLVSLLQDIQEKQGYLHRDHLKQVAMSMNISLPQVYGVATFFKSLSLVPQGKHKITLCLGTACHVRGGPKILNEIIDHLNIGPDETTRDGLFTLKTVNCLGACAIGPVMVVDDKYYGQLSASKAKRILDDYRKMRNEKITKCS